MEVFNPDDSLKIEVKREDENIEENNFKATKMEKDDKQRIYNKVYSYLTAFRYPQRATKADKTTIRKQSKKFGVLDCILHYKEKKGNSVNEEQLTDKH